MKFENELKLFKLLSIGFFGPLAEKYSIYFENLKQPILEADLKILFRTYVSMIIFSTFIVYSLSIVLTLFYSLFLGLNLIVILIGLLIVPLSAASLAFTLMYFYPISKANQRKSEIEANLPFAINNMAAVAASGVPPRTIFKVISEFEEYGEISKESTKITRNIEAFGLDEITAIKDVSLKTPSRSFRNLLEGIITTIQRGGDINLFLKEQSDKALFDYRIRRERYNQNLSVYADLYTALLIAAPLLFIAILSVLSILGGTVFGLATQDLIRLGVFFLIPTLNILFLVFIHISQPRI